MSACCEIGTYECCVYAFTNDDKDVYVDKCLLEEIKSLIDFGVVTLGCCCGHGKMSGYIQVNCDYQSISKMYELGYKRLWNQFGSIAFLPKTQCPKNEEEANDAG